MNLPEVNTHGYLDPGIYIASMEEVLERFGTSTSTRQHQGSLLRLIVERAKKYPTIKRVLLWGSFVSAKPDPADLDYSIVVDLRYNADAIAPEDRRFFRPFNARMYYGADANYLVIHEYPLERYFQSLELICHDRRKRPRGILEVSCHENENRR